MANDNPNIKLGDVNIPAENFEPKNAKVRISILIDGNVLLAYKAAADKKDIGYQTLMHEKLCEALPSLEGGKTIEERLRRVENVFEEIFRGSARAANKKGEGFIIKSKVKGGRSTAKDIVDSRTGRVLLSGSISRAKSGKGYTRSKSKS